MTHYHMCITNVNSIKHLSWKALDPRNYVDLTVIPST